MYVGLLLKISEEAESSTLIGQMAVHAPSEVGGDWWVRTAGTLAGDKRGKREREQRKDSRDEK